MRLSHIHVPQYLETACSGNTVREQWLAGLPAVVNDLCRRWDLVPERPFEQGASCSWVCPCVRRTGEPAVLKIGMPHMEARDEIDGLLLWNGEPTVMVHASDKADNVMLLERCVPGTPLKTLPEAEQDRVVAQMLRRLWSTPPSGSTFRPLSDMIAEWNREVLAVLDRYADPKLAEEGVRVREELATDTEVSVLLATDLHAGNILRAERAPWLVIDPKPFVGDPAYDATQHLLNCPDRLRTTPRATIDTLADLLELDRRRLRLWMFGRLATEFGGVYQDHARSVERILHA